MPARKFVMYVVLTLLACGVLAIVIPDNKAARYNQTTGDARKGKWVFDVLHSSATIDVAFFGSSYTLQAIDPRVVEEALDHRQSVFNFAMPYAGRDLEYVLVKETLQAKRVKVIVVQLRVREGRTSHPHFCELADKQDLATAPLFPFLLPLGSLDCVFRRQLGLLLPLNLRAHPDDTFSGQYVSTLGFKPRTVTMPRDALNRQQDSHTGPALPSWFGDVEFSYSKEYVKRIAQLASASGSQLVFLYLPNYKQHLPPRDMGLVSSLGKVVFLPDEVIDNPQYREDEGHFNAVGAGQISRYVGDWLSKHCGM